MTPPASRPPDRQTRLTGQREVETCIISGGPIHAPMARQGRLSLTHSLSRLTGLREVGTCKFFTLPPNDGEREEKRAG
jgi:hypothetical protein